MKKLLLALTCLPMAALPGCMQDMDNRGVAMASMPSVQSMIADWPEASRMAAMDMMQKYGPPQEATMHTLTWHNNGPWKWTRLSKMPVQHNFPMPHPDVLEQAIDYEIPEQMVDELAMYDGSVMTERTAGEMSARCDKEGANFLAINLAHDVATRAKTVDQARAYYTRAMMAFKNSGTMDPYMQGLRFTPPSDAAANDPDRPTI